MSARVIVTGAASGIGAASGAALRARGARVVGLDLREGDGVLACDVRAQESVDAAVAEAIETLGGLDVLVNNAGIGLPQSAGKAPGDDALAVLAVNLVGPWRVTAAALPALRAAPGRGRVLNVASGLAHMAVPLAPAYCMSKRGLVAYSDVLRLEFGHEIDVTTIYPGYVRTPIHDASAEAGFTLEGVVPAEPLAAVAGRIVRAALGPTPARDVATTPIGTVGYALMRRAPRRLLDRMALVSLRRQARAGALDGSAMAADLAKALREGGRR